MKIGDRVKFLSETGGGRIAGFQGKNIALVEDEDGFQIPTPLSDLVLSSSSDEYRTTKPTTSAKQQNSAEEADFDFHKSVKAKINAFENEDEVMEESDPSDKEVTFVRPVEERKGGNVLNAYLAFVPEDSRTLSTTNFLCYIVNDSNYYLRYSYLTVNGQQFALRSAGEIEPNTKLFIEEFGYEQLNMFDKVGIQMFAYKRDKEFVKKPVVDVQLKIDKVKFYKLHSFRENDFFEQPALLYTIVENDAQKSELCVDADTLAEGMLAHNADKGTASNTGVSGRSADDSYVRRYADGKKGNPFVSREKGDVQVVDLHADAILETTAGMSHVDILNYQLDVFRKTLEENKGCKGKKIVFIHGKGEGVLRNAVVNELRYRYKKYKYQDASFQEYGYGATQVTIY